MYLRRAFFAALFCALAATCDALAADSSSPRIDLMEFEGAETVCKAWPHGAAATGLVWVGYPASVKPFGMRGYMEIDGKTHPLRQVAYAHAEGAMSIYYRTLGDYHYDVYLTLSGFSSRDVKGSGLTGTLVVSRFGIFNQIMVSGRCGD